MTTMCCNLKVYNIEMEALRDMNEYSYDRKLAADGFANGLPEICQDIPFDIDMIRIVGLRVRFLPNLCYGICDLAGKEPLIKDFQRRNLHWAVASSIFRMTENLISPNSSNTALTTDFCPLRPSWIQIDF